MNVATQISGNIRPDNEALHSLISMLTHIGILVTQPLSDESFFYNSTVQSAWQHYNEEVDFYESIAHSAFHIIYNDDAIDNEIGLQILYAMTKKRPVLMTGAPHFANDISPFVKGLVVAHLPQFHSVKLPELDLPDLQQLLGKLKITDYSLTKSQHILISSMVKGHFRDLLDHAKPQLTNSRG
jgi:hypothetical protein